MEALEMPQHDVSLQSVSVYEQTLRLDEGKVLSTKRYSQRFI